ncbi:MAG: LpqN/LpqT family lipoprotein, partial [Mycobacterium sp.]
MTHMARTSWRIFMGGMAAGFIGVVVFAGGKASADPAFPAPPVPVPGPAAAQTPAPPVQNLTALPGGGRYSPTITPPLTLTPAPAPASAPFPPSAPAAVPAMPPTVTAPVTSTLRDYLKAKGVKLEAQRPQTLKALEIILPVPTRWTQVPDPNVPDAFAVIADRVGGNSVYTSNAQVVVYKLIGDFDTAEAITHGYADSQQLLGWQTTNASLANVNGFASAKIEGTYRENDMTLNTSRRTIIVTAGADKYLVLLSVTTAAAQAVADAPATDAIISGFQVKVPGAPAPASPAPAAAAVPAPTAAVPAPAAAAVPAPAAAAV